MKRLTVVVVLMAIIGLVGVKRSQLGEGRNDAGSRTPEDRSKVLTATRPPQKVDGPQPRPDARAGSPYTVSARFVDLINVQPMSVKSGLLNPEFFDLLEVASNPKKVMIQDHFDRFRDEFATVESSHAELVSHPNGDTAVRVLPCVEPAAKCFGHLKAALEIDLAESQVAMAVALIRRQFRQGGADGLELSFLESKGIDRPASYRLEKALLNSDSVVTHRFEVGDNLPEPSFTSFKRWAHLAEIQ